MKKTLSIIVSLLLIFSTILNVKAFETNQIENSSNEVVEDNTNDSSINEDDLQDVDQNENTEIVDDNENSEINTTEGNDEITNQVTTNSPEEVITPKIMYKTHVQDYGWSNYISEGVSGTVGKSKRLEAIKMKLDLGSYEGSIEYATHIQDIGWTSFVSDDQLSGTEGKLKRLEAIKIKLVGDIANYYDVYYRVHIQDNGWLDWACNGASAGSETYGKRLEGIEIKLIKKGDQIPENTQNPFIYPGHIYYSTHVQDYGWLSNIGDGKTSGTSGQSKRVEAIKIKLTGEISNYYDVYYRVHAQDLGWMSWTCNDSKAGTEGLELRVEAIQICLVEKGGNAPGDISRPFVEQGKVEYSSHVQNIGWQNYVNNGNTSGTVGQGLRLEALKIRLGDNSYEGNIEYSTHVQDYGWMNYSSNDSISGTIGQSKRIEAIKIRLTGEISNYYDVFYRVQCQDFGWLGWTCNDRIAGTTGGGYRIESIQIKLYPKNITNPGISHLSCITFEDKNGFKVCKDANGTLYEDAQGLLGMKSSYVLRVNKSTNVVTVLAANGTGDYNIAYKRFICSTGNNTPYGTYYTPVKYRWRYLVGPSYGQYSTRIVGGILFHSVPYSKQNPYTLQASEFNKLGTTCSHGCVRLMCRDAKWIYDNCSLGTRVDIVSGADPLSKPSAPKIPANQRWDPTDPNI